MHKLGFDNKVWTELDRLLDIALDLPAEARPAWLESLPAEYASAKPHLAALLDRAADVERSDFLNLPLGMTIGSCRIH